MRDLIRIVENAQGSLVETNDEPPFKKPKGVHAPAFTKDGRRIELSHTYMGVRAMIEGEKAGYMEIGCSRDHGRYEDRFWVARLWVYEQFRGQGVATAMYDYAYRAGFRPLSQSKSLTDGGKGVWKKHLGRKQALGLDHEYHSDYPNRFHWRPLPPEQG